MKDKGAGGGRAGERVGGADREVGIGEGWAREGASGGSLKGNAEPNESEASHEASVPEGELAGGSSAGWR